VIILELSWAVLLQILLAIVLSRAPEAIRVLLPQILNHFLQFFIDLDVRYVSG